MGSRPVVWHLGLGKILRHTPRLYGAPTGAAPPGGEGCLALKVKLLPDWRGPAPSTMLVLPPSSDCKFPRHRKRGERIGAYLALGKQGLVSMPRLIPARVGLSRASSRWVRVGPETCVSASMHVFGVCWQRFGTPVSRCCLRAHGAGCWCIPRVCACLQVPASRPLLAWE